MHMELPPQDGRGASFTVQFLAADSHNDFNPACNPEIAKEEDSPGPVWLHLYNLHCTTCVAV